MTISRYQDNVKAGEGLRHIKWLVARLIALGRALDFVFDLARSLKQIETISGVGKSFSRCRSRSRSSSSTSTIAMGKCFFLKPGCSFFYLLDGVSPAFCNCHLGNL